MDGSAAEEPVEGSQRSHGSPVSGAGGSRGSSVGSVRGSQRSAGDVRSVRAAAVWTYAHMQTELLAVAKTAADVYMTTLADGEEADENDIVWKVGEALEAHAFYRPNERAPGVIWDGRVRSFARERCAQRVAQMAAKARLAAAQAREVLRANKEAAREEAAAEVRVRGAAMACIEAAEKENAAEEKATKEAAREAKAAAAATRQEERASKDAAREAAQNAREAAQAARDSAVLAVVPVPTAPNMVELLPRLQLSPAFQVGMIYENATPCRASHADFQVFAGKVMRKMYDTYTAAAAQTPASSSSTKMHNAAAAAVFSVTAAEPAPSQLIRTAWASTT